MQKAKNAVALGIFVLMVFTGFFYYKSREKTTVAGSVSNNNQIEPTISASTPVIGKPALLVIPKINIKANVEDVGLDKHKKIDIPKNDYNVAWYELGAKPGENGKAVMAGHLDTRFGGAAVFYDLGSLTQGDTITIIDENEKQISFEVTKIEKFKDANFPIGDVFGSAEEPLLNLITCEGTFNKNTQNYSDRLVVFTKMK